jgi:hypothetical protein
MSLLNSFFGKEPSAPSHGATPMDVVTYTASLASNPKAIDPTLDALREITSRVKAEQDLSSSDQAALADVYLKLETYLTHQETIRSFTVAEIRQRVENKFGSTHSSCPHFWQKIRSIQS